MDVFVQTTTWNEVGHLATRATTWGASGMFGALSTRTETLGYDADGAMRMRLIPTLASYCTLGWIATVCLIQ